MKIGQKSLVRWMSKLVAQGAGRWTHKPMAASLRELDNEQLRQVGGGLSATQLPKVGGW